MVNPRRKSNPTNHLSICLREPNLESHSNLFCRLLEPLYHIWPIQATGLITITLASHSETSSGLYEQSSLTEA